MAEPPPPLSPPWYRPSSSGDHRVSRGTDDPDSQPPQQSPRPRREMGVPSATKPALSVDPGAASDAATVASRDTTEASSAVDHSDAATAGTSVFTTVTEMEEKSAMSPDLPKLRAPQIPGGVDNEETQARRHLRSVLRNSLDSEDTSAGVSDVKSRRQKQAMTRDSPENRGVTLGSKTQDQANKNEPDPGLTNHPYLVSTRKSIQPKSGDPTIIQTRPSEDSNDADIEQTLTEGIPSRNNNQASNEISNLASADRAAKRRARIETGRKRRGEKNSREFDVSDREDEEEDGNRPSSDRASDVSTGPGAFAVNDGRAVQQKKVTSSELLASQLHNSLNDSGPFVNNLDSIVVGNGDEENQKQEDMTSVHEATLAPREPRRVQRPPPPSAPMVMAVHKIDGTEPGEFSRSSNRTCIIFSVLAIIILVVVISVSVAMTRDGGSTTEIMATPSPTPAPTPRAFDASRMPALVSRLESFNLPFGLTSPASEFALDWLANVDGAFLDFENADEVEIISRFALAAFYHATDGPNWSDQCNFLSAATICDWRCFRAIGVACDGQRIVRELDFTDNYLSGSLPQELLALSGLRLLWLTGNDLVGTIIPELYRLTYLSSLDFAQNSFTGAIAPGINALSLLEFLSFTSNKLSGELPMEEIASLTKLHVLDILSNPFISGTLPTTLGDLSMLEELRCGSTGLGGTIPSEIGRLAAVEYISLDDCSFEGQLPSELGNLSNLSHLDVADNRLEGTVPLELASLPKLEKLILSENMIVDDLDPTFCADSALPSITEFVADCLTSSKVVCSCCTACFTE